MGVYIKGMEMPKKCADCRFIMVSNTAYSCVCTGYALYEGVNVLDSHCPLVEVPTPHGRLIDADELHEKMYHESFEVDSDMQKWESGCWIRYKVFENCENQASTIIEAEE